MALLSLRAYARHRAELGLPGQSHQAVQKAIRSGRIQASPEGLIDPEAADALWAARTDEGHRRNPGQERNLRAPRQPRAPPSDDAPDEAGPIPDYQQSRARREAAEAGLAEVKLALEEGRVVPAADVEARLSTVFAQCKTRLLGVPARARQRDPTLSGAQIDLVEELLREALQDLSGLPPEEPKKRKRAEATA